MDHFHRGCGPVDWGEPTLVCLEDGSEILTTAELKEHVSTGHSKFNMVSSKSSLFDQATNLDMMSRLYHKLVAIGGSQAIRADVFGWLDKWQNRMKVSMTSVDGLNDTT